MQKKKFFLGWNAPSDYLLLYYYCKFIIIPQKLCDTLPPEPEFGNMEFLNYPPRYLE